MNKQENTLNPNTTKSNISFDLVFQLSASPMVIVNNHGEIQSGNNKFKELLKIRDLKKLNYFNNKKRVFPEFSFSKEIKSEFVHEGTWEIEGKLLYLREHFCKIDADQIAVNIEDISQLIKANRNISISEEKFNIVLDQIPIGIYRLVATGELLFANLQLAKILGYENVKEIIGSHVRSFFHIPEENINYVFQQFKLKKPSYSIEFKIKRKDQSEIWVRDTANITYDNSNQVLFIDGIVEDISLKKNTESELDQLITAINQISEVIVITDLDGKIIYTNPAFERLTMYSLTEVSGKKMNLLKSGHNGNELYKKMWKTILSGNSWSGNLINKKKNGDIYEEHCVITPVRNVQGAIVSFVSIKRDITEEKKLENNLRNSQKLQAIGTLAGGIAHDFNNILMGMQVFTEILLKKIPEQAQEHQLLEKIYVSQNRAKSLIKQILSFSRLSGDERESLEVHLVVKEALKLIKATLPSTIKLEQKIENCGCITANPAQIQQIVMNLCTNAHHAMEGDGTLLVELKKMDFIEFPDGKILQHEKKWVCLMVKDTGCGIEDKIKERIFEPFFTTKTVGSGTGLGLSTVHGIVKQYGGEIHFTSKVGIGTNFYIYLPAL